MRTLLLLFTATLLLTSCAPQKRLNRLLKRHPELIKTDTVWRKDTVVVWGTKTDTIIKIWQKDTVIIRKDQLTMKYFMRNDSTIYLEGECDTVTIIRDVPTVVNSVTGVIEKASFLERWAPWIILLLLFAYLIISKLKK